jgi:hypothetical protein
MRACWEEAPTNPRSDGAGIELPVIEPAPVLADGGLALWIDAEG